MVSILLVGQVISCNFSTDTQEELLAKGKDAWKRRDELVAAYEKQKISMFKKVLLYSGKGVCKKTEECRMILFGPKTCNGKRGFLIYSSVDVETEPFEGAVEDYNAFMDNYNTVTLNTPPCVGYAEKAKCIKGACMPDSDSY
jgi:hypothetical protein